MKWMHRLMGVRKYQFPRIWTRRAQPHGHDNLVSKIQFSLVQIMQSVFELVCFSVHVISLLLEDIMFLLFIIFMVIPGVLVVILFLLFAHILSCAASFKEKNRVLQVKM